MSGTDFQVYTVGFVAGVTICRCVCRADCGDFTSSFFANLVGFTTKLQSRAVINTTVTIVVFAVTSLFGTDFGVLAGGPFSFFADL